MEPIKGTQYRNFFSHCFISPFNGCDIFLVKIPFQRPFIAGRTCLLHLAKFKLVKTTVFENYQKSRILIFTNFCPIKTDLSGNIV